MIKGFLSMILPNSEHVDLLQRVSTIEGRITVMLAFTAGNFFATITLILSVI